MHVLVVEDDCALAALMADVLGEENIQVTVVTSIEGALSAMATNPPALVLLDEHLPDGGGLENIQALKAAASRPPPIVLFTADRLNRSEIEDAGADGYIAKPFELDTLVQEISRWLRTS